MSFEGISAGVVFETKQRVTGQTFDVRFEKQESGTLVVKCLTHSAHPGLQDNAVFEDVISVKFHDLPSQNEKDERKGRYVMELWRWNAHVGHEERIVHSYLHSVEDNARYFPGVPQQLIFNKHDVLVSAGLSTHRMHASPHPDSSESQWDKDLGWDVERVEDERELGGPPQRGGLEASPLQWRRPQAQAEREGNPYLTVIPSR